MNTRALGTVVANVLSSFFLWTCSISCFAASEAEKLLPANFDAKGEYSTYSVDELAEAVEHYEVTKEKFIGKKVKVLATYAVSDGLFSWLNPYSVKPIDSASTGASKPKQAIQITRISGKPCELEICTRLQFLARLNGFLAFDTKLQNFKDPYITAYFRTSDEFTGFVENGLSLCEKGYQNRCYVWVRGTLRFSPITIRHDMLPDSKNGLFYVEVDEYRLYRRSESESWLNLKRSVGFTIDALPTIIKVLRGGIP